MDDFELKPAHDLGMEPFERSLSLRRESGLGETITHLLWWGFIRAYLRVYHRMSIEGRQHIPTRPPFVMIANHASHLDAMMLASPLRYRMRDRIFPVAAGDVFFETPGLARFATLCINALPMWRNNCGRHALGELRQRLVEEPCGYILFPEGMRSFDGTLLEFKAGLGMLVAGTDVPVIPCYLDGAHRALPKGCALPRPRKVHMRVGPALRFNDVPNRREGWEQVVAQLREAVIVLSSDAGRA